MPSPTQALEATPFKHAYDLDQHTQQALLKPNPRLDFAVSNSRAHSLSEITISPLQGQFLAIQCQLINAKSVLEVGTLGGYSTNWFASTGAKVTSIEINPRHRDVALENTKGLDVEIILGAALDVLPQLAAEKQKFDLVFIDAEWDEQFECFDWAVQLTRPGGCIYVDNVVRMMLQSDLCTGQKESVVAKIGRDDRVVATLVPTVGSHKNVDEMFDGFVLAMVKG